MWQDVCKLSGLLNSDCYCVLNSFREKEFSQSLFLEADFIKCKIGPSVRWDPSVQQKIYEIDMQSLNLVSNWEISWEKVIDFVGFLIVIYTLGHGTTFCLRKACFLPPSPFSVPHSLSFVGTTFRHRQGSIIRHLNSQSGIQDLKHSHHQGAC